MKGKEPKDYREAWRKAERRCEELESEIEDLQRLTRVLLEICCSRGCFGEDWGVEFWRYTRGQRRQEDE